MSDAVSLDRVHTYGKWNFVSEHDTPVAATQTTDRTERSGRPGRHISLRALTIFHIVAYFTAGWITGWIVNIVPWANMFAQLAVTSLGFGQMCLLGIWLGLGTSRWRWVITALPVGIVCLTATMGGWMYMLMVLPWLMSPPLVIAAVLLIVRRWKAHLMFYGTGVPVAAIEGLQFSIRHLFLVTTVIAVLLVMARGVGDLLRNGVSSWFPGVIIGVGIMSLCFISITLAALWASLGVGRPTERILVVLLLAFFVGALVMYVGSSSGVTTNWQQAWMIPTVTVLATAIVTASLLVVRSNGYRLVRRSPSVTPKQNEPE